MPFRVLWHGAVVSVFSVFFFSFFNVSYYQYKKEIIIIIKDSLCLRLRVALTAV